MNTQLACDTICIERYYAHPISKVFCAFSNPVSFEKWFSPTPEITTKTLAFDFQVDGYFCLEFAIPEAASKQLSGHFLAIEENSRIEFSWIWAAPDMHENVETRVCVAFQKHADGTKIIVHHHKLPSPDGGSRHQIGWDGTLQQLAHWLEIDRKVGQDL